MEQLISRIVKENENITSIYVDADNIYVCSLTDDKLSQDLVDAAKEAGFNIEYVNHKQRTFLARHALRYY